MHGRRNDAAVLLKVLQIYLLHLQKAVSFKALLEKMSCIRQGQIPQHKGNDEIGVYKMWSVVPLRSVLFELVLRWGGYKQLHQGVYPVTTVQRHITRAVSVSPSICVHNCTGCVRTSFIVPACGHYLPGMTHIMCGDNGLGSFRRTTLHQKTIIG